MDTHRAYDRPEDGFSPEEVKHSADLKVRGVANQLKRIQAMENNIPTLSKRKSDKIAAIANSNPTVLEDVTTHLTLKNIDCTAIERLGDLSRNERAVILSEMWLSIEQDKSNIHKLLELAQDQFTASNFNSDPQALVLSHVTYAKYAELISSFDRELVKLIKIIMDVRTQWDMMDMASANQEETFESFADRASNIRPSHSMGLDVISPDSIEEDEV
jgi:hypothetical protein